MAKRKNSKKVATKKKPAASQSTAELERSRNRVDREILAKINERAEIEQQLAEIGENETCAANAKSFSRLDDLFSINKGPLAVRAVRAVFREIVAGCRELVAPCKVAYLGPEYSYSHLAATEQFGSTADLIPVGTIAAVFEEVEHGNVDYGLVPLENSTDGRITDTLDIVVAPQSTARPPHASTPRLRSKVSPPTWSKTTSTPFLPTISRVWATKSEVV